MTEDTQDTTAEESKRDIGPEEVPENEAEGIQKPDAEAEKEKEEEPEKLEKEGEPEQLEKEESEKLEKAEKGAKDQEGIGDDVREEDDGETEPSSRATGRFGRNVDRYVLWGALLLSGLLGTVAAFNLYFQVGSVINVWIAGRYQPIFQAGFNLVVLLVAGFVAVRVADRLEVGG